MSSMELTLPNVAMFLIGAVLGLYILRWMKPKEEKKQKVETPRRKIPTPAAPNTVFFTSAEVAKHNLANDCWVSKFNKVFDLTLLLH